MQTQHYLSVTGWDYFDLAVLVGGNRLKIYHVERDEELIAEMISLEGYFWEAVLSGNAPAVDFNHDSTIDMLQRKYVGTNGIIIELPNEAARLHDEKKLIAKEIKQLTADGKEITAQLLEMVGQNAAGRFMNAEGGYRRKLMEAKDVAFTKKEYFDFRWVKNI